MTWRDRALLRPSKLAEVSGRSLRTIQRKLERGEIESRLEDGCRLIPIRAALRFVGEESRTAAGGYAPSPTVEQQASEIIEHFRREHG